MGNRKVFISFLGNSRYKNASFKCLDGVIADKTPFVQEVLCDSFCRDIEKTKDFAGWENADVDIFIICTSGDNGSFAKNWIGENNGTPLSTILSAKKYASKVKPVQLPEGAENDMWQVFNSVYSLIHEQQSVDEGDHIYLDVTNVFRSFPVMVTTLLQYAKFMKKCSTKGLYYGMLTNENDINKIQDMTPILELQDCVDVASGFIQYGRLNKLAEKVEKYGLTQLNRSLNSLDKQLLSNQGEIRQGKEMFQIKGQRRQLNQAPLNAPIREVMDKALSELSSFKSEDSLENYVIAARWAFKHDMLAQAYAFGKEYINIKVAESLDGSLNPYKIEDDDDRDKKQHKKRDYLTFINGLLAQNNRELQDYLRRQEADFVSICEKILQIKYIQELRPYYAILNRNRNQICHVKMGNNYEKLKDDFIENFNKCLEIIQKCESDLTKQL